MNIIIHSEDTHFKKSLMVEFDDEQLGVISKEVYSKLDNWDPTEALTAMLRAALYQPHSRIDIEFNREEWNPVTHQGKFFFRAKVYTDLPLPFIGEGSLEPVLILTQTKDDQWTLL